MVDRNKVHVRTWGFQTYVDNNYKTNKKGDII